MRTGPSPASAGSSETSSASTRSQFGSTWLMYQPSGASSPSARHDSTTGGRGRSVASRREPTTTSATATNGTVMTMPR
jgi:hypothetical protein